MLTSIQTPSHYLQNKSFIFFNRKNSHKTSTHFHKNNTQNTFANTLICNTFFYISINLKVVPFLFMVYIIFIRNLRLNLVLSINIMPMENTDTIFKRKKTTKNRSTGLSGSWKWREKKNSRLSFTAVTLQKIRWIR